MSAAARNASAARQGVKAAKAKGREGTQHVSAPKAPAPVIEKKPDYSYAEPPKALAVLCGPCGRAYIDFSRKIFAFTYGSACQNFILGVICLAGLLVGISTFDGMEDDPTIEAIDTQGDPQPDAAQSAAVAVSVAAALSMFGVEVLLPQSNRG